MDALVSVIIPAYNNEKYVAECVQSVLDQTYDSIEVIAVNDGSTDSTPEILQEFGDSIKIIHQENRGTAAALNTGIRASTGSLVSWLASDDVYMPEMVSECASVFQSNEDMGYLVSAVFSDFIAIDAEGKRKSGVTVRLPKPENFAVMIMIHNFINANTVMMRSECFNRVGYYDESLQADCDGDMWLRMVKAGYIFKHIPKQLVKYRHHDTNTSRNVQLLQSCKDRVRMKALEYFTADELFGVNVNSLNHTAYYVNLSHQLLYGYNFQAARLALVKGMELNNGQA